MNKTSRLIALLGAALFSFNALAAETEVKFVSPEKYRDIYEGNTQSKTKFRQNLFNSFEATFKENGAKLPDDMKLEISVLDVDLAGKVTRGLAQEIRQVTDKDFPRIHFYMVLRDAKGNILFQGEQNLQEQKAKHKAFRMKGSQTPFYLETMLIDKFFDLALIPAVNKI